MTNDNPVLVEVTRGALTESLHRGVIAVADADGRCLLALGHVEHPVFPRSAVKALQAIPLIESGAADAFGLGDEELAIACASHSGEAVHVKAVRSLLSKAGVDETLLACGAHWPLSEGAARDLLSAGRGPRPIHNNCSGKHAGMLATAIHLGLRPQGYERPDHPVQIEIARVISELCEVGLSADQMGIDGCSVPTFALPLEALAKGFARPRGSDDRRRVAARCGAPTDAGVLRGADAGGRRRALRYHRHDRARPVGFHQGWRGRRSLRGPAGAWHRHCAQGRRWRQARGGNGDGSFACRVVAECACGACRVSSWRNP